MGSGEKNTTFIEGSIFWGQWHGFSGTSSVTEGHLLIDPARHGLIFFLAITFAIFDAVGATAFLIGVVLGNFEYRLHVVLDHLQV